jgi:hypothetical protein
VIATFPIHGSYAVGKLPPIFILPCYFLPLLLRCRALQTDTKKALRGRKTEKERERVRKR